MEEWKKKKKTKKKNKSGEKERGLLSAYVPMWAHLISAYVFTAIVLLEAWDVWRKRERVGKRKKKRKKMIAEPMCGLISSGYSEQMQKWRNILFRYEKS